MEEILSLGVESNPNAEPDVKQVPLLRVEDDGVVVAHLPEVHGPTEVLVPARKGDSGGRQDHKKGVRNCNI